MKIILYLIFLLLSFTVIFGFDIVMRLVGEKIYLMENFWAILIVCFSVIFINTFIGAILNKLKELISRFNSYGKAGRIPIILAGWLVMLNMFYTLFLFFKEGEDFSTTKISAVLIFYFVSIMVLIVNFCYTRYTHPELAEQ